MTSAIDHTKSPIANIESSVIIRKASVLVSFANSIFLLITWKIITPIKVGIIILPNIRKVTYKKSSTDFLSSNIKSPNSRQAKSVENNVVNIIRFKRNILNLLGCHSISHNVCIDAIIRKIIFYLLLKISIFALYILYCYSANTTSTFVFKRLKIFSFKLSLLPSAQVCDATKASYLFYSRLHKYFFTTHPTTWSLLPNTLPSSPAFANTNVGCSTSIF